MAELMKMAADTWSRVLNRERPLWEMTFVEGLNTVPGIAKGFICADYEGAPCRSRREGQYRNDVRIVGHYG